MGKRGLTHRQIAEICDVSVSVVGDWVGPTGSIPHDLQRVAALAKALAVRFDWLVLGYSVDTPEPHLTDIFDEVLDDRLSGLWRIECRKLTPKGKK